MVEIQDKTCLGSATKSIVHFIHLLQYNNEYNNDRRSQLLTNYRNEILLTNTKMKYLTTCNQYIYLGCTHVGPSWTYISPS